MGDVRIIEKAVRRHDQEADLLSAAFDNGIGRERGGDGDEIDAGELLLVELVKGLGDTDGVVPLRGQRLGLLQDAIDRKYYLFL